MPGEQPISAEAERRLTIVETVLRLHVQSCDKRAAVAEKLLWFVSASCMAGIGYLLKLAFHI